MFFNTVKNSLKTVIRSFIFFMAILFLMFVSIHSAYTRTQGYYDQGTGELITNTDPRFVFTYNEYIQTISNVCTASVMLYAMPVVAVTATAILVTDDYRSKFFEIEKSYGASFLKYTFGRLTALIILNSLLMIAASFTAFHLYVFISGGVDGMRLSEYIADSSLKLIRYISAVSYPALLLFINLTYFFGCLLKSGIGAGVGGMSYVLLNYLFSYQLRFRIPSVYHSYLAPIPNKLRYYFHCLGSSKFNTAVNYFQTSKKSAVTCIILLVGVSLFYISLSIFLTNKRNK